EHVVALEAGRCEPLVQALPDPLLVAVTLRRVEVPITEPQSRLDCVDAHLLLQRHGSEPDGGNAGSVRFNYIHCASLPDVRSRPTLAGAAGQLDLGNQGAKQGCAPAARPSSQSNSVRFRPWRCSAPRTRPGGPCRSP